MRSPRFGRIDSGNHESQRIRPEDAEAITALIGKDDEKLIAELHAKVHQLLFGVIIMVIGLTVLCLGILGKSGWDALFLSATGLLIAGVGGAVFDRARPWRETWGLLKRTYRPKPFHSN